MTLVPLYKYVLIEIVAKNMLYLLCQSKVLFLLLEEST